MPKESEIRKKAIKILTDGKWIYWYPPKVKYKQSDVFGIIDVLALKGRRKKNIQLTTLSNVSVRRKKILNFLKMSKVELPVEIWAWSNKSRSFKIEKVNVVQKKKSI
ncbi:hypothetical protein ES703_06039 [subsurface metagenome]